ncbi:MAG: zinc/manganese transporter permease [Gammaproteobacteria bacterium (ex Lamellibrachia satsuma)]|nr:MAG: metal ABC transporter permease [Gammaproteobacteria bacterium (ex Lamellibrachia satsuma)]RRS33410.1 MAG: zinc/manganese transporter permease [Gammaproteobacteria bacterium (ex Lamellibrachia satsuma)]RRS35063.1 MAG: zinc/manganese transporter permease [Gammaproteobacteria bacterium (ex Lamellibrachia satsuma)]
MNWEAMDIGILGPAFLAGLVVLATHVPLGQRVLERGIIFIDLAIAQLAGVGVIAAHAIGLDASDAMVQLAAFSAAIAGALLLYWTERSWPNVQEAIIGSVFVLGATAAILLLAQNPMGGEHLKDLLVGQILWVDYPGLGLPALISLVVLAFWFGVGASRNLAAFYGLFAISVTVSVQLVGVYLVFATLIIPALAGRFLADQFRLVTGYIIGVSGYGVGLSVSAIFDLPAGPVVVWTLAAVAAVIVVFGRLLVQGQTSTDT